MRSSLAAALALALAARCASALPATGRKAHRRALLAAINVSKPQEVYRPENDWTNDANNYLDDYISRLTELEQAAAAQGGAEGAGAGAGAGAGGASVAGGGAEGGGATGAEGAAGSAAGAGAGGEAGAGAGEYGAGEQGGGGGAAGAGGAAGGAGGAGAGDEGAAADGSYGPAPEDVNRLSIRDIDYIVDQPNYVEQFIAPQKYAALEKAGMSGELPTEPQQQVPVSGMVPAGAPAAAAAPEGQRAINTTAAETFLYGGAREMRMQRRELVTKSAVAVPSEALPRGSTRGEPRRSASEERSTKGSDADSNGVVREAWKKAENADKDLDNIVKDVLLVSSG